MWIRERLSGRAVTERDAYPPQSRGWQWPQPCAPPLPGAHIQTHPAKSKASQLCLCATTSKFNQGQRTRVGAMKTGRGSTEKRDQRT